jgi:lysozyme C
MCKLSLIFLIILSVAIQSIFAKTFKKCELANYLKSKGFRNIADWVCLAQYESSFTTSKTHKNKNCSVDYGLFQINSKYWCRKGRAGGDCKIDCNKFLDNDITDDLKCVQLIYKRHGFAAWYGWRNHCNGKVANYLNECGMNYP